MKTPKIHLGVVAQRTAYGAGVLATGVLAVTMMTVAGPHAAAYTCNTGNWCNSISSDCPDNAACTCKFTDCPDTSLGCYACVAT